MTIVEWLMDPTGDVTYTVTAVHLSTTPHHEDEALVWLGIGNAPRVRTLVWSLHRQRAFPKVGDTVRLKGVA